MENAQHFSRIERWATFDCYGTLIDWNSGLRNALGGEDLDDQRETLVYLRVPYDIDSAARKIRAAGLPSRLADRLYAGR